MDRKLELLDQITVAACYATEVVVLFDDLAEKLKGEVGAELMCRMNVSQDLFKEIDRKLRKVQNAAFDVKSQVQQEVLVAAVAPGTYTGVLGSTDSPGQQDPITPGPKSQ